MKNINSNCSYSFKDLNDLFDQFLDCKEKQHLSCSEQELRQDQSNNKNWNLISSRRLLSEDFIRDYADKLNWYYITKYQKISEVFIMEMRDKVNWNVICDRYNLSVDFISNNLDKINKRKLLKNKNLSKNAKNYIQKLIREETI